MKITSDKSRYHRFSLYYDYSPDKVEFCRLLKDSFGWQKFSFNSDEGLKRWVFSDVFFVKLFVERFGSDVQVDADVIRTWHHEEGIQEQTQTRQETMNEVREKKTTDLKIKGIDGELYDYQKVGIEFLMASGGRAIIADPPGLGKSVQALGYATHSKFDRVLVICPASVKSSWENEIYKWTKLSYVVIDSKTDLAAIPADTKVWVINYDILKKHLDTLLKTRFDLLVADECHLVKNHQAQRTKAIRALAKHIPHIVLLSGTPLLSRPVEMFTLLNMIDPMTWSNWYEYTRRYCGGHQGRFGYDAKGATNVDELHSLIKHYFIRRQKTEVLSQLPPKNRIDIPFVLDGDIANEYDAVEESLVRYLREHKGKQPAEIAQAVQAEKLTQLNILRQLTALGGVKAASDLIEAVIDAEEKILVFSSFIDPLNQLQEKFNKNSVMLTGSTPVEERGEIVRKFQNDPNTKVFFGGIKSAGVGITLTAAQNVLFLDYSWNPADHQQAEDRLHRPGQEASSVNIYQLHAKGTVADKLQKVLKEKQKVFDRVIEGAEVPKTSEKQSMNAVLDGLFERWVES